MTRIRRFEITSDLKEIIIFDSEGTNFVLPLQDFDDSLDILSQEELFKLVAAKALSDGYTVGFYAISSLAGYAYSGNDRILGLHGFVHPSSNKIITFEIRKSYIFYSTFRHYRVGYYTIDTFQYIQETFKLSLSPHKEILEFILSFLRVGL